MKIYIFLLLVILSTFSGRPGTLAQTPFIEKYNKIVLPIKLKNDSNEIKYYKEVNRTDILTPKLIAKIDRLERENEQKDREIKRLNKTIFSIMNNKDTIQIFIHDTLYKKRKGIFNFLHKNKKQ